MDTDGDVIVIGGGIIGMSVAYQLASDGIDDVIVLEKEHIASKASGRAAGFLSPSLFTEFSVGTAIPSYIQSFYDELEREYDSVTLHTGRAYTIAHSADGRNRLEELQEKTGERTTLLSGSTVAEREPTLNPEGITAALAFESATHTDPYSVTWAIYRSAVARGVTVNTQEVIDIEKRDDDFVVSTPQETYSAPVVVNAGGAWSAHIASMLGVSLPLHPRPSEIAVLELSEEVQFPMVNLPDLGVYAREEPNGDVLIGAGTNQAIDNIEAFSTTGSEEFLQMIAETGPRVTPQLLDAGLVDTWAGRCSATPDRRPLIGETDVDGFYVCAGMNGAGIMHAPFAGRLLADLITDSPGQFDPEPFRPDRHDGDSFEILNAVDW